MGRAAYDPYGNLIDNTIPLTLTDRLFTGQIWEEDLDLYNYRTRFYDPMTGSFTQPDSIVPDPMDPRAWNRFGYVYGNPANYVDPSGHIAIPWALIGIAALGGSLNVLSGYTTSSGDYTAGQAALDFGTGALFGIAGYGIGYVLTPQYLGITAGARYFTAARIASLTTLNVTESIVTTAIRGGDYTVNDLFSAIAWGVGGSAAGEILELVGKGLAKSFEEAYMNAYKAEKNLGALTNFRLARFLSAYPNSPLNDDLINKSKQLEKWYREDTIREQALYLSFKTLFFLLAQTLADTEVTSTHFKFEPFSNPRKLELWRP